MKPVNKYAAAKFIIFVVLFFSSVITAESSGNNSDMIVSTEWLSNHLSDNNIVLLQVGKKDVYDTSHIPGARYISYNEFAPEINGLSRQLPTAEYLDSLFEGYGISNNSRIILYTDDWITPMTRLYLTLDYIGLDGNTSILDGGLIKWRNEGKKLSADIPKYSTGTIVPKVKKVVVTKDEVLSVLNNPDYSIIDARTEDHYSGTHEMNHYPRPGHIAGAFNIQFTDLTTEEAPHTFKSENDLKKYYDNAFVSKNKTTIAYCHIGQQATLVYFIGKMLGYNMKLYDGSFQEWSADDNCPVVGKVNVKKNN